MSFTQRLCTLCLISLFSLIVATGQTIADDSLVVTDNGYVGIGTTTPVKMLTVNGSFLANTNTGTTPFYISRTTGLDQALRIEVDDNNVYFYSEQDEDDTKQRGGFTFVMDDDGSMNPEYRINLKSGTRLVTIKKAGYVGIGTDSPQKELDVNGSIIAQELILPSQTWADYVFEGDYDLPSLEKVEAFIQSNKHLPDMPSSKKIASQGLPVSQIMTKQMQKIEELTLYVIELKKENQRVEKENQALKTISQQFEKRLAKLEAQIATR